MDRLLEATARVEDRHFWFRGFRRFVRPLLAEAAAGLTRPALLDCGCGTGANLALLGDFGRAFGIDLTWTGLRLAHERGRRRLARASVAALPVRSGSLDIVTSFDVLSCREAPDEERAVAEMYRVLWPGGALVINVAALDALRGRHSVLGGEVRRYTRARLRAPLERAGFRVVRMTYTNATLVPILLPLRAAQRLAGLAGDPANGDFRLPPDPVNTILSGALAIEAAAARVVRLPFGSSLLCLVRKPCSSGSCCSSSSAP